MSSHAGSARVDHYPRDVWLLCVAAACGSGAFLGLRQLLNSLYLLRLGYGPEVVGTVFAIGSVSFASSSVPGGMLGVRHGPRRMLIVGMVVNLFGMGLLPLTEAVPDTIRFPWVMLSQVVSSSGWSFYVVNSVALMAAFTTVSSRRGAFALREALSGLGSFGGALVGGFLPVTFARLLETTTATPAPYRFSLWGAIVLGLFGLAAALSLGREEPPSDASVQTPPFRMSPALLLVVASAFCTNGAHAACKAFAAPYLDQVFGLPTAVIGTVTSVALLVGFAAALSGAKLTAARSSGRVMMAATAAVALSLLLMAAIPQWQAVGLGIIGVYAALAIWRPAFQALQMEIAAPEWRSLVAGATAMGMSLGFGSMSFTGGYVAASWSYSRVFVLGAVMALSALVALAALQRRQTSAGARGEPSLGAGALDELRLCEAGCDAAQE